MSQILSHLHVNVILNNERIVGFAETEQPVEFPTEELLSLKRGADGATYGTDNAMFGGPVIFRLAPTSTGAKQFIRWRAMNDQAGRNGTAKMIFNGSYSDTFQGRTARFSGGVLMSAPAMSVPNTDYEAIIHFDLIVGIVEGANFLPPGLSPV